MSVTHANSSSGRVTILIAEDDPQQGALLSETLDNEGYRVILTNNGANALQIVSEDGVDLALLDVRMPVLSGFEVCQAIRSDTATRLLPVVLVTGLNDVTDRVHGIECGADDFLSKPYSRMELLARIRSLIRLKLYTDELENAETVLCSLAASIEEKDAYTKGHCARLSNYAVEMGKKLGLSEELRVALRRGGMVHDIGKLNVPDSILEKPGPLTSEERKIMQEHPVAGERICAPLKSFRLVLPVIRHHHEKMDGSGYPDGLRGEQIPITARILSVVDFYDALTSDRPYRRALSSETALSMMYEDVSRNWLDAELVGVFESMVAQLSHQAVG